MKKALPIVAAAMVLAGAAYWWFVKGIGRGSLTELALGASPANGAFRNFMPEGWAVARSDQRILESLDLPFLHRELVGRRVAVAEIKGNGVHFKRGGADHRNDNLVGGRVVILADTGELLLVELFKEVDMKPLPGQHSVEEAEKRLEAWYGKYTSLGKTKPEANFNQVLGEIYKHTYKQVEKAQRVVGMFVECERTDGGPPESLWVVNFFGFPPYPAKGAGRGAVTAAQRSHARFLVRGDGTIVENDNGP